MTGLRSPLFLEAGSGLPVGQALAREPEEHFTQRVEVQAPVARRALPAQQCLKIVEPLLKDYM